MASKTIETSEAASCDKENLNILSRPTRTRKPVLTEILSSSDIELSPPLNYDALEENDEYDPKKNESDDDSDLPSTPLTKKITKPTRGHGRGRGTASTRGRGTSLTSGRGTAKGSGTPKVGRGSRKSGEFSTKASQKLFYKKLSGLDNKTFVSLIKDLIESEQVSMTTVNNKINSNIDIDSIMKGLEKAKKAIFKAMPNPWRFGGGSATFQRNDFARKRCTSSQNAFKTLFRNNTTNFKGLDNGDLIIDFVLKAFPVVSELPQWIGCFKPLSLLNDCLDMLGGLLMQAIPKLSNERLQDIVDEVTRFSSFTGEMGVSVENEKMGEALALLKSKI